MFLDLSYFRGRAITVRTFERLQDDFKEIKKSILTFMDWVLTLPESLEIRYNQEIQQFEEEHGMTYITSFERKKNQKGMQQGECAILHRLLLRKFRQVPPRYLAMLLKADSETLLRWSETMLEAKSLAEIFEE